MKIKEILEQLDTFTKDERLLHIAALVNMLTDVSKADLQEHQRKHLTEYLERTEANWQIFLTGQNKVLRRCVELETSEVIGDSVRAALGLDPITLETEVEYS